MPAGADAADQFDTYFRQIVANDPDIQAVIRRVWGEGPRPSDTPKDLERANAQASQEIGQILKRKGIDLPDRTFVNPRSGTIEGHRGWSGLNNWQRAAIIAAAAGTGLAGAAALGAFGGAGAAAGGAAGGAGAITPGVGAGFAATVPTALTPTLSAGTLASMGGAGTAAGVGGTAATSAGLLGRLGGALKTSQGLSTAMRAGGAMASGAAEGAEQDRLAGVQYGLGRDRLGLDAADQFEDAVQSRGRLDLDQRKFGQDSQNNAFTNAMRAAFVNNYQPAARPAGVPTINFGSAGYSPNERGNAAELERQATLKLLEGEKFDPLPELKPYGLSSPTTMPGSSTREKLLGILGIGGTALGSLRGTR